MRKFWLASICIILFASLLFAATVGNVFDGSETSNLGLDTNYGALLRVTMPETGTITQIDVLMDAAGTGQYAKGVIYDNDGAGADPGTLLGSTAASGSIGAKGTYTVTFDPGIEITASDVIYIGVLGYGESHFYYEATSSSNGHKTITGNYATPANSPTVVSTYDVTGCVYATYTASGGGGTVGNGMLLGVW